MDLYDDFDYSVKSTDDFYTYNSRDFDEMVNQDIITEWDFDPFGPDAEVWGCLE